MLGFRGAARYISAEFGEAFAMECEALKRVRNDMGLTNVEIMVPFVRTLGLDRDVLDHIRVQAEPPNISPAGSKPIGEQRHHYFFMA
jgi:phosphoenolpyruvate synthase/pyruvate phosphate dikinase